MKRICVFCGSSSGLDPVYLSAAEKLGEFLAQKNIELVYGGGRVGLMGKIADTVMSNGGGVIGVIPAALDKKEIAHRGITKLHVVDSMHERKAMMADLSDGFVAMPGGFGTFEEFCEIITWAQLGLHQKPCALLNVDGYYDPLLTLFDKAVTEGFLRPANRGLVLQVTDASRLLDKLAQYTPVHTEKWISRDDS